MPVFIVVQGSIRHNDKFEQYAAASRETIAEHEGRVIARGAAEEIHGHVAHPWGAIIEFPNHEAALAWYRSKAYQALLPLREEASESSFTMYDGFEVPT